MHERHTAEVPQLRHPHFPILLITRSHRSTRTVTDLLLAALRWCPPTPDQVSGMAGFRSEEKLWRCRQTCQVPPARTSLAHSVAVRNATAHDSVNVGTLS